MQLVNIGFGSLISVERLIAVVAPDSAPVKRLVQEARDRGMLIDATFGRKTASVFIMDSDHVVLLEDELVEIAKEIIRNDAANKVLIGLDYFDASINRIAAWVVGTRNMQKALLYALLQPWDDLKALQNQSRFTELMCRSEELKTYPWGAIWDEYCRRQQAPQREGWYAAVVQYEADVLSKR